MKVLKFGGTSVGKPESIRKVADIIMKEVAIEKGLFGVVSAFTKVTDSLINIAKKAEIADESYLADIIEVENRHFNYAENLLGKNSDEVFQTKLNEFFIQLKEITHGIYLVRELTSKSLDFVMSFGERLSAFIISKYLNTKGINAEFLDARKIIKTDNVFGKAKINFELTSKLINDFFNPKIDVYMTTGFIGSTKEGITTTLGRGGSDLTASIIGAALNTDVVELWTDVDGVMSANPSKVPDAFSLEILSYSEAMELSHFGAKVIHPPTIQPVMEKGIKVKIMNTFNPEFPGTVIQKKSNGVALAKGITSIDDISLLTLLGSGMVGVEGIASRMFGALARKGINVILISQASSEHSICAAVKPKDANNAKKCITEEFLLEIKAHLVEEVSVEKDLSIIAIVGEQMRKTQGVAARLFSALGEKNINIVAIAQGSSELNISVVIKKKDENIALKAVHESFFAKESKLFLFMIGTGLISTELIKQISENYHALQKNMKLNLIVAGIANSRKMVINQNGLDLEKWRETIENSSEKSDMDVMLKFIKDTKLNNCVLIDCTASSEISNTYAKFLESGVSVVAANKVANTRKYSEYVHLHELAHKYNVHYLYETNAGAGLPVISTLQDLMNSGDKVIKIEAILSGTISYIFNNFTGNKKFSDVVKKAKDLGYTEPDPRDDLSGLDFARKILLLARESNKNLEMKDVEIDPLLPEECIMAENVDDFFEKLKQNDSYFSGMLKSATDENKKLSYIAKLENNKAKISLENIDNSHPFYSMEGSDNIIALTTVRYSNPLIIKGAGAGAEVTAAGVFADIFKIANAVVKKRSYN